MEDEVNGPFDRNRFRHVCLDEGKVRLIQQVLDVAAAAGEQVVQAENLVALGSEPITEVGSQKARAAGDNNALRGHGRPIEKYSNPSARTSPGSKMFRP